MARINNPNSSIPVTPSGGGSGEVQVAGGGLPAMQPSTPTSPNPDSLDQTFITYLAQLTRAIKDGFWRVVVDTDGTTHRLQDTSNSTHFLGNTVEGLLAYQAKGTTFEAQVVDAQNAFRAVTLSVSSPAQAGISWLLVLVGVFVLFAVLRSRRRT